MRYARLAIGDWRLSMTRQQAIFLIVINAIVSALISLGIVYAAFTWYPPGATVIQRIEVPVTVSAATPTRRATALTYIVQPGDTLAIIAARFNISLVALMQVNGMTNPNVLAAGQSITIPPLELTPTPSASRTLAATPLPVLKIAAIIRASSAQSVEGEVVIIQNLGARVNLKGWQIVDLQGNYYVFPDFVLEANASVRLHTKAGLDTATDLYWGRAVPVWGLNDTATLKDRNGAVQESYTIQR